MQLRPLRRLALAELDRALEPRLVGLFASHQGAEVSHFKSLREVLIVVESLESLGFQIQKLQIKPLRPGESAPMRACNTGGYEALVSCVNGECDQRIHKRDLAF